MSLKDIYYLYFPRGGIQGHIMKQLCYSKGEKEPGEKYRPPSLLYFLQEEQDRTQAVLDYLV